MGRLLVPLGGGGGASSDECTASANDILKGKTTITKDSDDEIVEGILELTGNTSTGHVLKGETFYTTDAHVKQTGTMPNNTGRSTNGDVPGISSSYSQVPTREGTNLQMQTDTSGTSRISIAVPAGYYDGDGYVNRPSSDFGTTSVDNVLSGETFTSTAGIKKSGTMLNRGAWGSSVGVNGSVTIPPGYHNGSGKVTNSVSTMGGGTYTPSTSAQKIYCSGKYMTGDIIFNGIPSNYVNPSTGAAFFENGSYGPMADLGAYYFTQDTQTGVITKTYLSASQLSNQLEVSTSTSVGYYQWVVFRRGFNSGTFKRFHVEYEVLSGQKTMFMFISTTTSSSGTSPIRLKHTGVGTFNGDYTLSGDNINYCIGFANAVYASARGIHYFKINKIIAYSN